MWSIEFYEKNNGTKPVEEFLDSLDKKMKAKAIHEILILKEVGNKLREPYSKPIHDRVFELRIKFSSNISRIFYFESVNKMMKKKKKENYSKI